MLAAAFMVSAVGCATDPEDVIPAPAPASASTTRDGVVVTVAASDDTVTGGDSIRLRVTVLNVGFGPVTWQSGGCGLLQWFGIDGPDLEQPPAGQVWPGVANLIKWSATSGGGGIAHAWVRQPDLDPDVVMACPANLAYDDIGPGETITSEAEWPATTSEGVPLSPSQVLITYAFPFVGRFAADAIRPNQNVNPIPVALPITIAGDVSDGISSTEAIDAALGDAAGSRLDRPARAEGAAHGGEHQVRGRTVAVHHRRGARWFHLGPDRPSQRPRRRGPAGGLTELRPDYSLKRSSFQGSASLL